MLTNDFILWKRFLSGDDDAYACIYKQYVQVLFSYAFQITSDRELIKDCIQDVFEMLYRNKDKLRQTDNIKVYLLVTMKNSLINAFKKEQIYSSYISKLETLLIETDTFVDKLIEKEQDIRIQQNVQKVFSLLTPRQKEIMHYRYIEGRSIKDIASLINMNSQSVQNIIQRSIKKLREVLGSV